ncbi:taurine ABC transporter substrate-binding protein, partial [Arthrospira platensis SPKY2]
DRIDFDPYPWKSFSYWITSQFERWGYVPMGSLNHEAIAADIFLTGLARQMAKQLGQQPPTITLRFESLKFDTFDPSEPENYARQQIEKLGF